MYDSTFLVAPGHTTQVFHPTDFRKLVEKTAKRIKAICEKHPEIEALAATGHSGLLLMGAVSYQLQMPQIAVRKSKDETSHDHRLANGWLGCKGYLILDDLIDSGETIRRIQSSIEKTVDTHNMSCWLDDEEKIRQPRCIAISLYNSGVHNYTFPLSDSLIPVYTEMSNHLSLSY